MRGGPLGSKAGKPERSVHYGTRFSGVDNNRMEKAVEATCNWPECSATRRSNGLCQRHLSQWRASGMDQADLIAMWTRGCAIDGCGALARDLDHDHRCCHTARRADQPHLYSRAPIFGRPPNHRCGRCNRAFVCSPCNRAIRAVEHGLGAALALTPERREAVERYLVIHRLPEPVDNWGGVR